jgi:hypothetical protein
VARLATTMFGNDCCVVEGLGAGGGWEPDGLKPAQSSRHGTSGWSHRLNATLTSP